MSNLPQSLSLTFLAAGLAFTGCATRKHVRNKIQPLEVRVDKLEEKTKTLETALADTERTASRADERAQSADARVTEAASAAKTASERAANAENAAGVAKSLAESSFQKAQEVERKLGSAGTASVSPNGPAMADNLQLVSKDNVLFAVGTVALSKSAREQLDSVASKLPKSQTFALELQGFADPSGSAARNLELSQKRAEAVARYLSIRHNIPLHRMHVLGMGSEKLPQSKSLVAKRLARRVEVRLYASDGSTASNRASVATTASAR